MSLDSHLQKIAIDNHKSATEVNIEYINARNILIDAMGKQYITRMSHIKYFAYKQIENNYGRK